METLNLSVRIFVALILAVVVGLAVGEEYIGFINWWIAPIGTIFINLIKMMIVPVVFSSLIVGVTSLGDTKTLGRISAKTVGIYLFTTAIAIVIGFAMTAMYLVVMLASRGLSDTDHVDGNPDMEW